MKQFQLFSLLTLFFFGISAAATASTAGKEAIQRALEEAEKESLGTATYGDLYLKEQREQNEKGKVLISVGGQYEFSNPYLNIYGVQISGGYQFGPYFGASLELRHYMTERTTTTRLLEDQLQANGITKYIHEPDYSIYAAATMTPFSGHLNFLNRKAIKIDFSVQTGFGGVHYKKPNVKWEPALLWSAGPRFYFTDNLALDLSILQEIEAPFNGDNTIFRTQSMARMMMRF